MIDEVLRAVGFKIHARQDQAEPVWVCDGKKYPERIALKFAHRLIKEAIDEKYGGGGDEHPGS